MKNTLSLIIFLLVSILGYCQPKIIAHRGFWNAENTAQNCVSSLYKAYEYGCYGSEFDVYMTKDSVLFLNHDDVINGKRIEECTYTEISDIRLGNGELMPTLEQFFIHAKNCPGMKLILEAKPHTGKERETSMAEKIVRMVEHFDLHDRVEYISFSEHMCIELKRLRPNSSVSFLEKILSPKELKARGLDMDYHYSIFIDKPEMVKEAKDLGLFINAWTVNDVGTMKKLIDLGVDYITTDRPLLLQSILKELR